LVVSSSGLCRTRCLLQVINSPQALINRADIKVDLDLVVLKGNKRKGKAGVAAVPELEWNIKSCFRKSAARSTYLSGGISSTAWSINVSEFRIGNVGKLSSITNHLEVSTLLFGSHGKLIPDVHPVTILTVDALTTNLNLDLSDELLTREIQPAGKLSFTLANLRESDLKVSAVSGSVM